MNRLIIITGMHRSGTSALAGALHNIGFNAGNPTDLLPPNKHNTKGYFEQKEFVNLNEELLIESAKYRNRNSINLSSTFMADNLIRSGWIYGAFIYPNYLDTSFIPDDLKTRMRKAVYDLLNNSLTDTPIVIKDPRFSLTLPWWDDLLPEHKTIFLVRNPYFVSKSLYKRDFMPQVLSLTLWIKYNLCFLSNTNSDQSLIISSENLIHNPCITLNNILSYISVDKFVTNEIKKAADFFDSRIFNNNFQMNTSENIFDQICDDLISNRISKAKLSLQTLDNTFSLLNIEELASYPADYQRITEEKLYYQTRLFRLTSHFLFKKLILLWKTFINKDFDVGIEREKRWDK